MSLAEQLEAHLRDRVRQSLGQVRISLAERVKERAPEGMTGQLRAGIMCDDWSENGDRYESTIRSLAPYSRFVDEGTGVFGPTGSRIYPTTARALRFYWQKAGGWVAFASVQGSPAQRFFSEPMAENYRAALEDEF